MASDGPVQLHPVTLEHAVYEAQLLARLAREQAAEGPEPFDWPAEWARREEGLRAQGGAERARQAAAGRLGGPELVRYRNRLKMRRRRNSGNLRVYP